MSNFEIKYEAVCNGKIPVSKYVSKKTGLTVCIAEVDGPILNGYICLATEAFDDDGLPHTLEHLIFLGSESYPYNGVLDLIANRCLASGTNAWTETDHTCYTMTNAGSEGFLKLLPIFMDHILYPILTESGYVTEVHNIGGTGEDGGIVYCEMQARENTGESRTYRALLRGLYPGLCGLKSETGGMLKNLRESTSHVKVKEYHKQFYRPENTCLIISGKVNPDDVFRALESVETKIIQKGDRGPFSRPWQTPLPPLLDTVRETVHYPSEDEEYGMVNIGFRGPSSKSLYEHLCISILTDYLDTSAISPVQRDMVEIDEPFAGDAEFNIIENTILTIYITFSNADIEKIKEIEDEFMKIITRICSEEEILDMDRISSIIQRTKLETLSNLEYQPCNSIAEFAIGHFLYGDDEKDLYGRLNTVELCDRMQTESVDFWLNLMKQIFIGTPRVVIIGMPSVNLGVKLGKEEEERLKEQKDKLGEDGIRKCKMMVDSAKEHNSCPAPQSVQESFTPPSVNGINLHSINPSTNIKNSKTTNFDSNRLFPLSEIPFRFMLDDISTNFVELNILVDTCCVPAHLRVLLPLYCDMLTESAVRGEDGKVIPYKKVVAQIEKDTLDCKAGLGVPGNTYFSCGTFPQLLTLNIRVEECKYETAIKLAKSLLQNIEFTAPRIKATSKKKLSDVSSAKRNGDLVTKVVLRELCYEDTSNMLVMSMKEQEAFLKKLLKTLGKDPKSVISDLNELKSVLTKSSNISVHLACDVEKLSNKFPLVRPWNKFISPTEVMPDRVTITPTHSLLRPLAEVENKHCIVGISEVESSYLVQAVPCISEFSHPDLPALMVLLQYFTQSEGPMWKRIRGLGLSYNYSMYVDCEAGLLFLSLSEATVIQDPYREARNIVFEYLDHERSFTQLELEAAKSSLIFELVEEQKTVLKASEQSLLTYFQDVPHEYNKTMLKLVAKVTMEDLQKVGEKYVKSMFDKNKARCAICVNPTKVKGTKEVFKTHYGMTLIEVSLDNKTHHTGPSQKV